MIISFDGNVFVGKTSLIQALSTVADFNVIDEQGDFINTSNLVDTDNKTDVARALQSRYIEAEVRRHPFLRNDKNNIVDRSFVSMAGHVYAINAVFNIDIRQWFLDEMINLLIKDVVIIPDVYCFLKCNHETIVERVNKDKIKITGPTYYNRNYLEAIDHFNRFWSDRMGGLTVDTNSVEPVELAKNLIQQRRIFVQGKYSTQHICDCLRDAFAQGSHNQ